jgi:hypothetical protein
MKSTVIAYHGTNVDPQVIRKEGLRVVDVEAQVERLMRETNGRKLPKWITKAIAREQEYRRRQHLSVHLTLSKDNANSYSHAENGEFCAIVRALIRKGLRRKINGKGEMLATGKRYIVAVELSIDTQMGPYHKDTIRDVYNRCTAHGIDWDELTTTNSWDIQVDAVPPEKIIAITECE